MTLCRRGRSTFISSLMLGRVTISSISGTLLTGVVQTVAMSRLPPGSLTANRRDRDVAHRRIGFGTMPMAFTGLDVHDIAHVDLTLFPLVRHHAGARGHDQYLVAGMGMPARGAALAEIHHTAVVVFRIAWVDDGLARTRHWAGPAFDPLGAFHGDGWDVFQGDDLHDDCILVLIL